MQPQYPYPPQPPPQQPSSGPNVALIIGIIVVLFVVVIGGVLVLAGVLGYMNASRRAARVSSHRDLRADDVHGVLQDVERPRHRALPRRLGREIDRPRDARDHAQPRRRNRRARLRRGRREPDLGRRERVRPRAHPRDGEEHRSERRQMDGDVAPLDDVLSRRTPASPSKARSPRRASRKRTCACASSCSRTAATK